MVARTQTKYESDSGDIHFIALSPDFATAAGTPPTGAINNDIKAKVSKSNREYGIRPRGVRLSRTIGTAPDTFKKYTFLPVLTPTAFGGAGFQLGATVTIGTTDYVVVSRNPEDY